MPQTSPMNWLITSLIMFFLMNMIKMTMNENFISNKKNNNKIKMMNLKKKW